MQTFLLFKSMFFSLKGLVFYLQDHKRLCLAHFSWKEKFPIFWQKKPWDLFLWEKYQFRTFLNRCFSSLKWLVFYPEGQKTLFWTYFALIEKRTKFPIFDEKPWTNPLEKCKIFDFFKSMFFKFKVARFLSTRSQNT